MAETHNVILQQILHSYVNVVILSFHFFFVIIRTCGKAIGNHCGLFYLVLMTNGFCRMVKMKIEVNCLKVSITQMVWYGNKLMKTVVVL